MKYCVFNQHNEKIGEVEAYDVMSAWEGATKMFQVGGTIVMDVRPSSRVEGPIGRGAGGQPDKYELIKRIDADILDELDAYNSYKEMARQLELLGLSLEAQRVRGIAEDEWKHHSYLRDIRHKLERSG